MRLLTSLTTALLALFSANTAVSAQNAPVNAARNAPITALFHATALHRALGQYEAEALAGQHHWAHFLSAAWHQDDKSRQQGDAKKPDAQTASQQTDADSDHSPPALNPGRPTITDPAPLTAPGWLESEFGSQKNLDHDRDFSTPLLLKLTSYNRRLEYRLATDGYTALGEDHATGIGDTYAALHYLFATQDKSGFDVAGRLTLKIPTAPPSIGTGKFDYAALGLFSRDFSSLVHGDFNLGVSSLSQSVGSARDTQVLVSGALTFNLPGKRWQYAVELAYQSPVAGGRDELTTMSAFSYAVHRYDVYDLALQWQLHGDGPNFQLLFGRTFFFGKLF